MKTMKIVVLFIILTLLGSGTTSCVVRKHEIRANNGQHRGWFKQKKHHHNVYVIKAESHKNPKSDANHRKHSKKR